LVAEVYPGSAAARAGLLQGDVITAIDGDPVNDVSLLNYRIGAHKAGDRVAIAYRRKDANHDTHAVAEAPPADPPRDEQTMIGRNPFDGATVVNLSPAVALELGGNPFAKGVLITDIKGGLAVRTGFRPGDVIRTVNGRPVDTVASLKALLADVKTRRFSVIIDRGGQPVQGNFQL
jgi:S1-C subfamily serine protease